MTQGLTGLSRSFSGRVLLPSPAVQVPGVS